MIVFWAFPFAPSGMPGLRAGLFVVSFPPKAGKDAAAIPSANKIPLILIFRNSRQCKKNKWFTLQFSLKNHHFLTQYAPGATETALLRHLT